MASDVEYRKWINVLEGVRFSDKITFLECMVKHEELSPHIEKVITIDTFSV